MISRIIMNETLIILDMTKTESNYTLNGNGSDVFASSLVASNTKHVKLT